MNGNMSRRAFVGGSAALAGAAALGMASDKTFRQIGPVDLSFYFLSDKPCVIPVFLNVDERRGLFVIRLFEKDVDVNDMSLPLDAVKHAAEVRGREGRINCGAKVANKDGSSVDFMANLSASEKTFVIVTGNPSEAFWFKLEDVRRVL